MTAPFTTRPELRGTFGMVASTHWLASGSAMSTLERGGNAFDAAVAAAFTLQVVEPHLNGLGGDLSLIAWSDAQQTPFVVCGQGVSPAAATLDRFHALDLGLVPATGLLAATVPGAFDAWLLLLRDYGTLPLADVLEYAIGYAEHGYPLVPQICDAIAGVETVFRDVWPTSATVYLPGDKVPQPRSRFRNPDLADTYRRLVTAGRQAGSSREAQIDAARDAFYRGFVAEALDAWLARAEVADSSGRRHRGLLTGEDLDSWRATIEPPATLSYGDHTICKTGPWGQGPVLLQQLALLSGFDLSAMDPMGADLVHTVVECAKLAFADRDAWYGDPDSVDVPLDTLLSNDYADARRRLVGAQAAGDLIPGSPDGREPRLPDEVAEETLAAPGIGEPTLVRPGDTCHVDVVDRHGNFVAATPSGGWLQSSPVVPGLGFCLGTRGQMFSLAAGLPNSLAPRKRPRTTLSPSLALRDGAPYLAFGTPGGDKQDQWSLIAFLRHIHHGLDLQAAIDAPMFHTSHFPSSFYPRESHDREVSVEGRFAPKVTDELERRGHEVVVEGDWSLGRVSMVGRDRDGMLKAGANPRGMQGYAVGR